MHTINRIGIGNFRRRSFASQCVVNIVLLLLFLSFIAAMCAYDTYILIYIKLNMPIFRFLSLSLSFSFFGVCVWEYKHKLNTTEKNTHTRVQLKRLYMQFKCDTNTNTWTGDMMLEWVSERASQSYRKKMVLPFFPCISFFLVCRAGDKQLHTNTSIEKKGRKKYDGIFFHCFYPVFFLAECACDLY